MKAPVKYTVKSCVPRSGGDYLITLRPSGHGVCLEHLEEGTRVSVTNGQIVALRLVSQ